MTEGGRHWVTLMGCADHNQPIGARGKGSAESQGDHSAVGGANDGLQAVDAQFVKSPRQTTCLILSRNGKTSLHVREIVDGEDAKLVGIDRATFTDDFLPPTLSRIRRR